VNACERCDATIHERSTLCRPCFHERQRARAALEREDEDRELLRRIAETTYRAMAREEGVSAAAIAKRVTAARARLDWLWHVRQDR